MKLRRYEAWVTIDDGDGEPLVECHGRFLTRGAAQRQINAILGDVGVNLHILQGKVYQGVDISVTGEVRET